MDDRVPADRPTAGPPGEAGASPAEPAGGRRVEVARRLRLVLEDLARRYPTHRVRSIASSRSGDGGPETLLQVDDFELRLDLLDAADGLPRLERSDLARLRQVLIDSPGTLCLILFWPTDDLLAVPLSVKRLLFLLANPDRLAHLLASAQPLDRVLDAVLKGQLRAWDADLDLAWRGQSQPSDARRKFAEALAAAIEAERRRAYRTAERREAGDRFPVQSETQTILEALDATWRGARLDEVVARLTRLHRGDAR